jgi:tetratricopeptide (TPR) repeat protein
MPLTLIAPSPDELERRLDRAREAPTSSFELVDALNELSWAIRQKEPQRSLELATEARVLAREVGFEAGLGWALRNTGHAHYRLAEYAAALADSLEAHALFERLELRSGQASAAGGVGMAYTRLADYKRGLDYHRESLRIRREMDDPVGEGASLNNLGVILFELADYPAALEHYLASLEIWKRLEHRDGVGHAFNNLGEVYEKMGDLDRALECYDFALEPFEEVGNGVGAGATRVNRARVLLERGDGEGALAVLEPCLDRARGAGDRWNEAACHPLMGRALLLLDRTDLAEAHFKEGLIALAELGLRYPEAEALLFLAQLRLGHGRYREAAQHLYRVLRIARETGSNALRYRAHRALSDLHDARGHARRALRHFRLYDRWKEKVLGVEADRRLDSILMRAEAAQAEREAEIQRLRHVDLAAAVARLEEADADKGGPPRGAAAPRRRARAHGARGLAHRRRQSARDDGAARGRGGARTPVRARPDGRHGGRRQLQAGQRRLLARRRGPGAAADGAHPVRELPRRGRRRPVGRRGVPDPVDGGVAGRRGERVREDPPRRGEPSVARGRRGARDHGEHWPRDAPWGHGLAGGARGGRRRRALPCEGWRPEPGPRAGLTPQGSRIMLRPPEGA